MSKQKTSMSPVKNAIIKMAKSGAERGYVVSEILSALPIILRSHELENFVSILFDGVQEFERDHL